MVPTTVNDDIESNGSRRISHREFNNELVITYKHDGSSVKVPCEPLISKYKDYFDKYILTVELNESEQVQYRYAPKTVSMAYYGTVAYWSVLLFINECHSIVEFEPKTMRYIDPQYIQDLMEEIFVLEEK